MVYPVSGMLIPERCFVEILEPVARLDQDLAHARPHRGVGGRVSGRDVIERIDEVENVLVAGWEVVSQPALLDQHAERVLAAGAEGGIAFPGQEPDVGLGGRYPAPEQRVEQQLARVAHRNLGGLGPVRHIVRVAGVEDGPEFLAHVVAPGAEELRARGIALPLGVGIGADDAGHLDAGVKDVLVGGTLGPETAADGRRVGRVHADLAAARKPAVDPVDYHGPEGPGKEPESLVRVSRPRLGLGDAGYDGSQGQCAEAYPQRASHTQEGVHCVLSQEENQGTPAGPCL